MRSQDRWFYSLCGLAVILFFILLLILVEHGIKACQLANALEPSRKLHPHTCLEFWLFRYQTLLAAIATLSGGVLAYFAVRRQTAVSRASEYRNTVTELRELVIDIGALRGSLFRVANVRSLGLPVNTAITANDIRMITDGYQADWRDGRAQVRVILSRFYRLVVTKGLAKSVAELSKSTYEIDNFGFKVLQKLAQSAVHGTIAGQQAYLNRLLAQQSQQGDQLGAAFFRACDELSAALRREAGFVEDELVRIAPPPGEEK